MENLFTWQKVILRNYSIVKTENIAKVLNTDVKTVLEYAEKLGISSFPYDENRQKKGFVTVIRNNWDLLSEKDIAVLLDISTEELKKILVEYDFLDVKLGEKPATLSPQYKEPNPKDDNSEKISELIKKNTVNYTSKPFDFYSDYVYPVFEKGNAPVIKERFLSAYSASYSGALLDENLTDYNEDYLKILASTGTTGIWLSDTLRNLAEFPFDKTLSPDYKIRIANLKKLTERCKKFGIDVYLYMNEPRSLPKSFFDKYPSLKGQLADDGTYCLCTSKREVKDYLYNAFLSIAKNVPLLKGVMTITMSENPTHCYSRYWNGSKKIFTDCPDCKNRKPYEVVAEINNIINKALKEGNGYTKLIANVWGFRNFANKNNKEVFSALDLLDKDIDVLCVSEYGKQFTRGKTHCAVDDYSISVVGPSKFSKSVLRYAKNKGHNVFAKVQMNNSWECSAVPYLPTFGLMIKHLKNLLKLKVNGLMLGWSLGGYPGGVIPLINTVCENKNYNVNEWYKKTYSANYKCVKKAMRIFDKAFICYPFSVDSIYFGGHNLGVGNLWDLEKTDKKSTMVCFTYDDYEKYTAPYGINAYISLMKKLCKKWEKGLAVLQDKTGNGAFNEVRNNSLGAYIHLKSALNLTEFSYLKKDVKNNKTQLEKLINNEISLTEKLIRLTAKDNKIGFEMTNHYYYTQNSLLEKLINLNEIKETLKQK